MVILESLRSCIVDVPSSFEKPRDDVPAVHGRCSSLRVSTGLGYTSRGRTGPLKQVHDSAVPARFFRCRYRAIEAELYVFWMLVRARALGVAAIQGRRSDSHLAVAPHSDEPFRR